MYVENKLKKFNRWRLRIENETRKEMFFFIKPKVVDFDFYNKIGIFFELTPILMSLIDKIICEKLS